MLKLNPKKILYAVSERQIKFYFYQMTSIIKLLFFDLFYFIGNKRTLLLIYILKNTRVLLLTDIKLEISEFEMVNLR